MNLRLFTRNSPIHNKTTAEHNALSRKNTQQLLAKCAIFSAKFHGFWQASKKAAIHHRLNYNIVLNKFVFQFGKKSLPKPIALYVINKLRKQRAHELNWMPPTVRNGGDCISSSIRTLFVNFRFCLLGIVICVINVYFSRWSRQIGLRWPFVSNLWSLLNLN